MGNKFTKRRPVVDERFTRPQGLYHHRDVDQKKLRRLILDAKLAPCYPGVEVPAADLDECPICFLFYPSLNRSKCCTKGICTECFLQMKTPHASLAAQCPFCKTPSYSVEYRGAKTVEEKGVEQAEEQKVIEAKIRIRQKELQDEEERMLRREEGIQEDLIPASSDLLRHNFSNLHGFEIPSGSTEADRAPIRDSLRGGGWGYEEIDQRWLEGQSQVDHEASSLVEGNSNPGARDLQQDLLPVSSLNSSTSERTSPMTHMGNGSGGGNSMHGQAARVQGSSFTRYSRDDEFDLDLEDIMVMEAIWLSIQDQGPVDQDSVSTVHGNLGTLDYARTGTHQDSSFEDGLRDAHPPVSAAGDSRDLPGHDTLTGGFAGAIAALAERQVHNVNSVAIQHTHRTDEMGSEDLQTYTNTCNDSIQGVDGTHSVAGYEDGVAEPLSVYATPARSHTQSERDEDDQGDQIAILDSKSEQEEDRELPTWMEPQDNNSLDREMGDQGLNNWIEVSLENGRALLPHACEERRDSISDWMLDHSSKTVEAGTSFSSSVPAASQLPWEAPDIPPVQSISVTESQGFAAPPLMVPESFEEQMMLAMALSLAEAQALAHPR